MRDRDQRARQRLGAGWTIGGRQRAYPQTDGTLLITSGDGRAALFTPSGSCGSNCTAYQAPKGEFSRVQRRADGTLVRTYPQSGTVEFLATGFPLYLKDRYGKVHLQYSYDGLQRLVRLTDRSVRP